MACCLMAPSHYLSQCWPRSLSPYDVTRPQWVKQLGYFFHQKSILFLMHSFVWNWSDAKNIWSALRILIAWCFSTRESAATVQNIHPCVSSYSALPNKHTPPRIIVMRYQLYDFDKHTPSYLPLSIEVWTIFACHNNHCDASPHLGLWGWYKFNNQ